MSIIEIDIMAKADNLQGALELLVMKILRRGPNHGFAVSSYIQQTSDEILRVEACGNQMLGESPLRRARPAVVDPR